MAVHGNAAQAADAQSGRFGQRCVGLHPHAEQHHAGADLLPVVQADPDALRFRHKGGDAAAQVEADAVVVQLLVDEVGHFRVEGRHHLRRFLHQVDLQTGHGEVFRHLQPDESAARHHGLLHVPLLQVLLDPVRVLHIAQGEDPFAPDTRQVGHHRQRAGGKQQLVVALLIGFAAFRLPDADGLTFRNDLNGLRKRANVYLETL